MLIKDVIKAKTFAVREAIKEFGGKLIIFEQKLVLECARMGPASTKAK